MISTVIIDDDASCRLAVLEILEGQNDIDILGQAENVEDGVLLIEEHNPDLILLDVEMPDGTGFDLLNKLPSKNFQVIFTTGHNAYAIKAFKHSAVDYILKPVHADELLIALDKVRKANQNLANNKKVEFMLNNLKTRDFSKLAIPAIDGFEFVEKVNIIYCEAEGSYTRIHLASGESLITTHNLKRINELLLNDGFYRVHKSYIVSLNQIKKILNQEGGQVILQNDKIIPIARRRKEEFLNLLGL